MKKNAQMSPPEVGFKKDLATMANTSVRTIDRWHRAGLLPPPLNLPGRPRWDLARARAWFGNGCRGGRR